MNKKIGSASIVVIFTAVVLMLYCTSTFADIRHMKNSYEKYKEQIIERYEQEYDKMVYEL